MDVLSASKLEQYLDELHLRLAQTRLERKAAEKDAKTMDNRLNLLKGEEKGKLCGDCLFEDVEPVVMNITPVPGGVGPMTIAMLMNNCVKAAENNKVKTVISEHEKDGWKLIKKSEVNGRTKLTFEK